MTHVVVAVDGSQSSLQAVDWAADEAARRGVPLKVVHASLWQRYEYEYDQDSGEDDDAFTRARQAADRMLGDAAARATARRPTLDVGVEVVAEEPVSALLQEGGKAAVLVLGSRGHGGFEGLLLGSVSLRVAGRADFPVVVVRGAGPSPARGRVVFGAGTHEPSGPAADFALGQAVSRRAELQVVHAWEPDLDLSGISLVMDTGPGLERARALLAAVTGPLQQAAPGIRVYGQAVPGAAAAALLGAAEDADLLVVGARRRHGQLGPVAHAVLHHAVCPVAVVPGS